MKKMIFLALPLLFLWQIIAKWPDQSAHLVVCDVGQGDAILIKKGFWQLLIDTGPDEKLLDCLNKQMPFWDKKIDVLVLTHYDSDHIGGFASLSELYHLPLIFTSLTEMKDSQLFLELKSILAELIEAGTIVKQPFLGQQISYQGFSAMNIDSNLVGNFFLPSSAPAQKAKKIDDSTLNFTFLTPYQLEESSVAALSLVGAFLEEKPETNLSALEALDLMKTENDNNGSIALLFQYGQLETLLLGDLENTREADMQAQSLIRRVDLVKIAHHGAKGSNELSFLEQVAPETALISCGLKNKFGHPDIETLSNLESLETNIWRSDLLGTIDIVLREDSYALSD